MFLILGLRSAPAAHSGVIAGCLPAVAGLMAVLRLGERPTRRSVISLALATAGVLAIGEAGGDSGSPGGVDAFLSYR